MNRLHCNLCGAEYYVNPPVMKQKKTRCPGCHVVQPLENYDRFYHGIWGWTKSTIKQKERIPPSS